ncbi:MAG: hypothetical protein LBC95_03290 [Candidatus Nomurabacteria bacterium]|jgi:hypothetical protein|nr:hypothetical protein [Candidatus Nomurabacteria bacterium]
MAKNRAVTRRRAVVFDGEKNFARSRTINSRDVERDSRDREIELERRQTKRLLNRRRRARMILLCIVVGLALVAALASQYTASISKVSYTNSEMSRQPNNEDYVALVQEYLNSRPTERFSFSFHANGLTSFLGDKASEIESATIMNRPFMGGELQIKMRQPLAAWQTAGVSEYVDASGAIFSKNFFIEPTVTLKDESGLENISSDVASRRFLNFIGQVISHVNAGDAGQVSSVSIPLGAIRYVEFRLDTHAYPIKAQIDREPLSQANDIVNIVKYLDANNIKPSYADVRIAGKGYWR